MQKCVYNSYPNKLYIILMYYRRPLNANLIIFLHLRDINYSYKIYEFIDNNRILVIETGFTNIASNSLRRVNR